MNLSRVEEIAEAVLYEGYMLYPYRPSSIKNQQRWNFGVLYPPGQSALSGGLEPCSSQTECLLKATASARLTIKVRFLHIVQRSVGRPLPPEQLKAAQSEPAFNPVDRLELAGRVYQPWQEAVERELTYKDLEQSELCSVSPLLFEFPAGRSFEYLNNEQGQSVGVLVRTWETLKGSVEIGTVDLRDGVSKVIVRVNNLTDFSASDSADSGGRENVLLASLVSAHTILGVEDGAFLSLLDPPSEALDLAAQCGNVGVWPVLAGDDTTTMLASPIILYDYPQIAPESAGNLFDSTEIDEILSLRILTLTDQEKQEMRQSDDRTRGILERTENMPEEQFMKMHGVLRGLSVIEEKTQ